MKIENQSTSFIVETIISECESIISTIEDFVNEYEDTTNLDDFESIRYIAESLQTLVLDFAEETDEYQTKCLLDEMTEESINLYQHIKYEVDALVELELFDYDCQDFEYLRDSINTIRSLFV